MGRREGLPGLGEMQCLASYVTDTEAEYEDRLVELGMMSKRVNVDLVSEFLPLMIELDLLAMKRKKLVEFHDWLDPQVYAKLLNELTREIYNIQQYVKSKLVQLSPEYEHIDITPQEEHYDGPLEMHEGHIQFENERYKASERTNFEMQYWSGQEFDGSTYYSY